LIGHLALVIGNSQKPIIINQLINVFLTTSCQPLTLDGQSRALTRPILRIYFTGKYK